MEYPNNLETGTEEFSNEDMVSGLVLMFMLVLMNAVLLLDYFGVISLA
ncbi:MAG: hypothetical protein SH809_14090 [Rhodothermales bacterium]|nr:hypothetical protein [Rhodothermales bacterium]